MVDGPGPILGVNGFSDDILKLNTVTSDGAPSQTNGGDVEKTANVDGASGEQITVIGTSSIFNPFYIFRYSEFSSGANANVIGNYNLPGHRMYYDSKKTILQDIEAKAVAANATAKKAIQNPTVDQIKTWTDAQARTGSSHKGPLYPYPYSYMDFYHCKYYGKIPNNRLLTLRRYPIPIEDNLAVASNKLPLVPIAQAVTWWGGDTGNTLSKVLGLSWGFNWKKYPEGKTDLQDVQGNETTLEQLLDAAGIKKDNETLRQSIIAAFANQSGTNPFALSGFDKVLQQNYKDQYKDGAYANRVQGPLNVIDETQIRDRGYTFNHKIDLQFDYKLRATSVAGGTAVLNPKIAMLDLISNFLSLTHNRATFWGGGYRYFQQTGALLPGFNTDAMEQGDYAEASKQLVSMLSQMVQGGAADLKEFLNGAVNNVTGKAAFDEKIKSIVGDLGKSRVGQNLLASRIGNLHQTPLVMRALADGRAVGEWHLMVGNPMDPLAVIGNLIMKTTSIEFDEELGADDFPTGVTFKVTLEHGRPRAKQDIESMFNHGGGDMYFTALEPPASTKNSYGEYTSRRLLSSTGTLPAEVNAATGATTSLTSTKSAKELDAAQAQAVLDAQKKAYDEADRLAGYFRPSVKSMYGEGFAGSPILTDYFLKLYTKD